MLLFRFLIYKLKYFNYIFNIFFYLILYFLPVINDLFLINVVYKNLNDLIADIKKNEIEVFFTNHNVCCDYDSKDPFYRIQCIKY